MTENATEKRGYHIVLVDDDPRIHEAVRDMLAKASLAERLESFGEPLAFLGALKQQPEPPDLVLLDVHFENSGLSGVEIIPFVREVHPYLPIVLLTGMEGEEIDAAQNFELVYYIPKPVRPEHLVRMVRFYAGLGQKSGQRTATLSQDLAQHKELVKILKQDLAGAEIAAWGEAAGGRRPRDARVFRRMIEILAAVLKTCELMPSFVDDLEKLFDADFVLLKKAIETVIHFDLMDFFGPGLNLHKYQGVTNVYSLRLTRKARIFYYQAPQSGRRRLIRLDAEHSTKEMDRWLKANETTYAQS